MEEKAEKKEAEIAAMPHKGKPSEFFKINRDAEGHTNLNDQQKAFVRLHYIDHTDPENMVTILEWLYDGAVLYEDLEAY